MKPPWQQRPPYQPPMICVPIPADWTPEQALAVVEMLDALRERIADHYAFALTEALRQLQCCGDSDQDRRNLTDEDPF